MLNGARDAVVSPHVNDIQKDSGKLLPTRGSIHDLSGAITHKREIITLYLEGYLTPEIAMKTKHSNEAVDRCIRDYHRAEMLWRHGITDLDKMSQLSRLAKRFIQQYIDLLPGKIRRGQEQQPPTLQNSVDSRGESHSVSASGETEAGSAAEQPAEG